MNYFEHHIGDYDQATAHLTACEDGIYSRLIRWYMASEAPLPGDLKLIQRRVRAHSKDERAAVQTVLDEFFELREDGYHQHRCDEEIARYQDKQAKAKRSAEARWSAVRPHSGRNANASLDDMRTHSERNADGMHRAPVPRHQTPDTRQLRSKATSLVASKPRPTKKAPPDFALSDDLKAWAAEHAPAVDADAELAKLKDHTFATARSDWPGTVRNWLRKAQDDAQARAQRTPRTAGNDEPEWRRLQRERNEAFLGPAAAKRKPTTIDMEDIDAAPRLAG